MSSINGQTPPRLAIPAGAVPIPIRHPLHQQFRNERLVGGPGAGFIRIRRPTQANNKPGLPHFNSNAITFSQHNFIDESKPVTEEPEDEQHDLPFIPQIVQQQQQQQGLQYQPQHQSQTILYGNDDNAVNSENNRNSENFQPTRFVQPERLIPQTTARAPEAVQAPATQRFSLNQERPQTVILHK